MIESPNDSVLQDDLNMISSADISFQKFYRSTVVITGATGLVGSQLMKAFACINRTHDLEMSVYGIVRNSEKAYKIFGDLLNRGDIHILVGDILMDYSLYIPNELKIDYLIHGAAITASKQMIDLPVDTINTSIYGTQQMLELAREKKVKSFVYLSSMEVYGKFDRPNNETTVVTEDMLGYLDLSNVRTNYPESKRLCENICVAYWSQYRVPTKIARLSQTFGAGILPEENRIFAQFARSVIEEKDIILHTAGKSEGNYCYTADMVLGLMTILLDGENGEAYNVSNEENHVTISDMAYLVAKGFSNKSKVVFDIPATNLFGYASDTKIKLSTSKLRKLGWKPTVSLMESYRRMVASMKESGV
ncbi:NAD-dependent epimerase/dehydratase family protein [Streptococcus anginosus]|uniref:NAD-dependent epimerase/dehydratase family protein n=1 Tax=Streptococcus anginosus TaxID=1328 RepID=UPI002EDA2B02